MRMAEDALPAALQSESAARWSKPRSTDKPQVTKTSNKRGSNLPFLLPLATEVHL